MSAWDDCIIDVSATGLVSVIDGILAAEIIELYSVKGILGFARAGLPPAGCIRIAATNDWKRMRIRGVPCTRLGSKVGCSMWSHGLGLPVNGLRYPAPPHEAGHLSTGPAGCLFA